MRTLNTDKRLFTSVVDRFDNPEIVSRLTDSTPSSPIDTFKSNYRSRHWRRVRRFAGSVSGPEVGALAIRKEHPGITSHRVETLRCTHYNPRGREADLSGN